MPAQRLLCVGKGNVGVNPSIQDGAGEGQDVERPLALEEGVSRRQLRGLDDVDVVAAQGSHSGQDYPVCDMVLPHGFPQRQQHILARVQAHQKQTTYRSGLCDHGIPPCSLYSTRRPVLLRFEYRWRQGRRNSPAISLHPKLLTAVACSVWHLTQLYTPTILPMNVRRSEEHTSELQSH